MTLTPNNHIFWLSPVIPAIKSSLTRWPLSWVIANLLSRLKNPGSKGRGFFVMALVGRCRHEVWYTFNVSLEDLIDARHAPQSQI